MVGTTVLKRVDENESAAFKQVKKIGVSTTEVTKRAALGDLQNRGVVRTITAKDAAQKDLKDTKLQNALRATKARVDTHWKKTTTTTTVGGATRTNVATGEMAPTAAAAQRKVLTRSNSVRLGTTTTTGLGGLQRHASANSHLLVGHNKVKTLTTKLVENKVQQVKIINKTTNKTETDVTVEPSLRREDSNLSRKSLTKIKAAITQNAATTKPTLVKSHSAAATLSRKEPVVKTTETTATFTSTKSADNKLKIVSVQTHSSKLLDDVKDIDEGDSENLVLVSDYVNDIYSYLFKLEAEQPVAKNHLEGQAEVYAKMRAVLIDWINEVHTQFHLAAETFQLAVAIIDRYLQAVKDTKRSHLQLVGVTALFIAAKYEELFPPAIADFIYITDDTYTGKQIRQMELQIFKALDCNLSRPLPIHFLRRFSKAAEAEDNHHAMSKYFLELAMIEYDMSHYKPSEIAAASLFLSLNLLKENTNMATGLNNKHWNSTLEWYSRYSPEHLRPIAKKIATVARNAPNAKLKAVYTKYQASKFQKVSTRSELYSTLMDSIVSSKE